MRHFNSLTITSREVITTYHSRSKKKKDMVDKVVRWQKYRKRDWELIREKNKTIGIIVLIQLLRKRYSLIYICVCVCVCVSFILEYIQFLKYLNFKVAFWSLIFQASASNNWGNKYFTHHYEYFSVSDCIENKILHKIFVHSIVPSLRWLIALRYLQFMYHVYLSNSKDNDL